MITQCFAVLLTVAAVRTASIAFEDEPDVVFLSNPMILSTVRDKRSASPGRAMMFHGYYHGSPQTQGYNGYNGNAYDPRGTMTAFAAGDSVTAGSSYYGGEGGFDCSRCNGAKKPNGNGNGNKKNGNGHSNGNGNGNGNGHSNGNGNGFHNGNGNGNGFHNGSPNGNGKPVNGNGHKEEEDVGYPNGNGNGAGNEVPEGNGGDDGYLGDQPAAEETPQGQTLPPAAPTSSVPKVPKKGPASDDSEEDDDEPSFYNNGKGRGRGPSYNSFFPMIFGGYPGYGGDRGNRDEGGPYNPGVATAIANSFSTGRGAVATSHATAYGGPHFIPSGGFRKNGSRGRPH